MNFLHNNHYAQWNFFPSNCNKTSIYCCRIHLTLYYWLRDITLYHSEMKMDFYQKRRKSRFWKPSYGKNQILTLHQNYEQELSEDNEVRRKATKAPVTKRRGIGPIRTEISPYEIREKLFIFQIVRFNGICIWQNYFCILPNFWDFGAKTSLFRYLINQKSNNFIKHCPPPRVSTSCLYQRCAYI